MRRLSLISAAVAVFAGLALAAATVGSGSPTVAIQLSFAVAFIRGQFSQLVIATPKGDVQSLGSPGLIQTFQWASDTSRTAALINPDPLNANITLQVYADLYSAFLAAGGVNTLGYPTVDTTVCPGNGFGVCNYQLFTKNYALFAYSAPAFVSYAVADPFYTKWASGGGITGALGPAVSAAASVTSQSGITGKQQLFGGGAIYNYTPASATTVATHSVSGAIYTAFRDAGGIASLGFPISDEIVPDSGPHKQLFENGRILWSPGNPAIVQFSIREIDLTTLGSPTLSLGGSVTLAATVIDVRGGVVYDRILTWSTSNGSAVTVVSNGYSAVAKAVGTGSARIEATGEGQTSAPVVVTVIGQCCAVGEGAPTQAMSQAFQLAAARNRLSVQLPNPTAVVSIGSGHVQTLTAADGSGTVYAIAESGQSVVAYVIGGALYAAYLQNGGFSGPLGYPASDASAGGTQSFASGAALAGTPSQLIPAPVAAKWIASGAETGTLGAPAGKASVFTALSGVNGNVQVFAGGTIYGILSGSRSGQAYILSGPILARYLALGGAAGQLGIPLSDAFASGASLRQNFQTGYIELQPGGAAVEHYNALSPSVNAMPASVAPGGKVRVAITGFAFGASIVVSVTGQSDFSVTAPGGEFAWDIAIPASAKASTVTVQARTGTSTTASGSYTITSLAALHPALKIVSGDQQSGAPGATLAAPLIAVLTDSTGNPIPGVPVSYDASPGASASVSALTDANGRISATFRLQPVSRVALLSISAAAQTVTFSALASATALRGYPIFKQENQSGGLTAALAAAIGYYQNAGVLSAPNGPATPASLDRYLTANGGLAVTQTGVNVVNPWIAMRFAGVPGGISIEVPDMPHVVDLVNGGAPVVLELSIKVDGISAGSAAVSAIGINQDGSIAISDPNPAFGRTSLSDYLNGFPSQGHTIQGALSGVIRISPGSIDSAGFVSVAFASSAPSGASATGACANQLDISDPAVAGQAAATKVGAVRFLECDGSQPAYQLGFSTQTGGAVVDLAGGSSLQIAPGSSLAWQVTRPNGLLAIAPAAVAIASVVSAADYSPGLSPGEIISIFGTGFTVGTDIPSIAIGGRNAQIFAAFPFQINAVIPAATATGSASLSVTGPLGTATSTVSIVPAAPGIFAVTNQDGTINTASNPVTRGAFVVIYCTGLGSSSSPAPSVNVGTTVAKPSFAGASQGFPGLFQINVQIPAGISPGAAIPLSIAQNGQTSKPVLIAIQ